MRNNILFSILAIASVGCGPTESPVDKLKTEVIKVHDQIMPLGENVFNAKQSLQAFTAGMDSLKLSQPKTDTLALHRSADSLIQLLTMADNAMSDWMHAFKVDYSNMTDEDAVKYLKGQKKKIVTIQDLYKQSLQGTANFLKQSNKK